MDDEMSGINVKKIADFRDPELDIYARLSEAELFHYYEPHGGLFVAESPNVIERAMSAGYEPVSFLMEERHVEGCMREILGRLESEGDGASVQRDPIQVYTAPLEVLNQLTGFGMTRGVLAVMKRRALPAAEEICKGKRRIAVLENVMNPTNVGAIFRSAAAIGMEAVLLTEGSSDPLYRRAARVSMGTVFQIPWTFLKSSKSPERRGVTSASGGRGAGKEQGEVPAAGEEASNLVSQLHALGFKTAAMALRRDTVELGTDSPALRALKAEERLAVILGTEGEGLSDETIDESDYTVRIPMRAGVDSLNVAAASAVAFWELR